MSDCQKLLDVLLPQFQLLHLVQQYLRLRLNTCFEKSTRRWFWRGQSTAERTKAELTRCGTTETLLMQLLSPDIEIKSPSEELEVKSEADIQTTLNILEHANVISVGLGSTTLLRPQDLQFLRRRIMELPIHFWGDKNAQPFDEPSDAREIVLVPGFEELKDRDTLVFPGHGFLVVRTGVNSFDVVESYLGLYQVHRLPGRTRAEIAQLLREYWTITVGKWLSAQDAHTWRRLTGGGDISHQIGLRKTYALPQVWQPGHPVLNVSIDMHVQYYASQSACHSEPTVQFIDEALQLLDLDPRREQEFTLFMGLSKQSFHSRLLQLREVLVTGFPRRSLRIYRPILPAAVPPSLFAYNRRQRRPSL